MQYLGGKSRIAKPISEIILAAQGERTVYAEPFLGAGSVALRVASCFERVVLADVVPDLVLLWRAVIDGWVPPTELSEETYRELRHAEPSALRAFAGFPCSFGGKWFGGYARDPKSDRNYAASASRSMVKRGQALAGAYVLEADYRELWPEIGPETVVYCDPPYAGTTTYGAAGSFDSDRFWQVARDWSAAGALVYVSEYDAPDDWIPVWEGNPRTSIAGKGQVARVTERLYALPSTIEGASSK